MAYADDLLDLAQTLANLDPRQACLRRAVSTAYYALFHLLVSQATLNWAHAELRPEVGRAFEHGRMKTASVEKRAALDAELKRVPDAFVSRSLHTVVNTFIQLQQKRVDADYDTGKEWTQTDVLSQIEDASAAFESWRAIRSEPVAQAYLVSLLGKRPRTD